MGASRARAGLGAWRNFQWSAPSVSLTLLICRIILGAGEGPAFFGMQAHAVYKWFPDEKRTMPTAILSQGSAFGVILAVPALNWIIIPDYFGTMPSRRARRSRPDVGCGVAGHGQGRSAGADGGNGRGGSSRALFPASDLAHLHRLLRRATFGAYWGAVALALPGSHPSSLKGSASWCSQSKTPAGFRSCHGYLAQW